MLTTNNKEELTLSERSQLPLVLLKRASIY